MGLLKYLALKSTAEHKRANSLRAQAAVASNTSRSPIHGAHPLAGNGPNPSNFKPREGRPILGDSAPRSVPSEDQPPQANESESDSEFEAESQSPPRRVYKTVPPPRRTTLDIDSHKARLYKLPTKVYDSQSRPITPASSLSGGRTFSRTSASSFPSKPFVDVVDAQSALKPLDFYDRIQANGAKHYGEDVADRNIAVNGVDLDSPQVLAFYGSEVGQRGDDSLSETQSSREQTSRPVSFASSTVAPSFRTLRALQSSASPLPNDSRLIRRSVSQRPPSNRAGTSRSLSTRSQSETSPVKRHNSDAAIRRRRNRDLEGGHLSDAADDNSTYRGDHLDHSRQLGVRRSSSLIQLRLPLKQADEAVVAANNNAPEMSPRLIRISDKASSRRSMQRYSMQSLNSLSSLSVREDVVWEDADQEQVQGSAARRDTKGPGRTTPLRQQWSVNAIGPTLDNWKQYGAEDFGAERSFSVRDYHSVDSETATVSSLSSNPFRPQSSRHTANTSLDMTIDLKGMNSSQESLDTISDHTAHEDVGHTALRSPSRSPRVQRSVPLRPADFNIDDYISTDDDSSCPRRPRGEDEMDLLFRDSDYGMGGSNLPGIPGPFGPMATLHEDGALAPSAKPRPVEPEHSQVHIPGVRDSAASHRRFPLSSYRMPTFGSTNSEDETTSPEMEMDEEIALDIPKVRRATLVTRPNTAPVDSREETASVERDADLAAKLRRESKRQNRAMGMPPAGRSRGQSMRETRRPPLQRLLTDEFDADVE